MQCIILFLCPDCGHVSRECFDHDVDVTQMTYDCELCSKPKDDGWADPLPRKPSMTYDELCTRLLPAEERDDDNVFLYGSMYWFLTEDWDSVGPFDYKSHAVRESDRYFAWLVADDV